MSSPPLMEHQRAGVEFLRSHPRALLADDPGLGKSRVALEAAVEPVLVVGPAMVIRGGVWDDEIAKWTPGLDVTQSTYHGVVGKEGGWTDNLIPSLQREWGTIILDESHHVKNRKAHWTLALKKLKSERTYLLTGTPLPNWAHESFTSLQLMFPEDAHSGGRLGSYWRWVSEWFEVDEKRDRSGRLLTSHAVGAFRSDRTWNEFVEDSWRDRMLRRKREDCLDLLPLTEQTIKVDMGPTQKKAYHELKKDFVTWLDSGVEVAAWSQAGQLVKLCQCATGIDVLTPDAQGSAKLDALTELLADRPSPTLVVAHFQASVEACARRARLSGRTAAVVHGGISMNERAARVRSFRSGQADVLCASLDTISEGLTLNEADQIIFVERSWRPSRNEQAMRRIHRIGQAKPVSATHLVTRGTVDERVLRLLRLKVDEQMLALGERDLRGLAA